VSKNDEALIERARRGDRAAFGDLVKQYQRRVYATAFHITGAHPDADDVAQDAFVRAWRGLAQFDGRADFFTWLYRIVVNVALNHLRAKKRLPVPTDDAAGGPLAAEAAPGPEPHASAEARELTRHVLAALATLSEPLRVTLILATVEELPYRTIADVLGIPEGTVAWRVNQARRVLKQKLSHIAPAGGGEVDADVVLRRTKQALGAP
jgi:RNA polymerase sigma-70 factor (ECF subfamily)